MEYTTIVTTLRKKLRLANDFHREPGVVKKKYKRTMKGSLN